MKITLTWSVLALALLAGCHHRGGDDCDPYGHRGGRRGYRGASADRPFPLGQVTDAHWETQQTNAEAADFIFYDHEFRMDTKTRQDTAELTPGGKKHLQQIVSSSIVTCWDQDSRCATRRN